MSTENGATQMGSPTTLISVTERERATLAAALANWLHEVPADERDDHDVATNGRAFDALRDSEISTLYQKLIS